jgi:hypothetical protein
MMNPYVKQLKFMYQNGLQLYNTINNIIKPGMIIWADLKYGKMHLGSPKKYLKAQSIVKRNIDNHVFYILQDKALS